MKKAAFEKAAGGFMKITINLEEGRADVSTGAPSVEFSDLEAEGVGLVLSALSAAGVDAHAERRSGAYISIVGRDYLDDRCRLKLGERSKWLSVDMWQGGPTDDPRLSVVQNRNQRHWKIPLSQVEDLCGYVDLIVGVFKGVDP